MQSFYQDHQLIEPLGQYSKTENLELNEVLKSRRQEQSCQRIHNYSAHPSRLYLVRTLVEQAKAGKAHKIADKLGLKSIPFPDPLLASALLH